MTKIVTMNAINKSLVRMILVAVLFLCPLSCYAGDVAHNEPVRKVSFLDWGKSALGKLSPKQDIQVFNLDNGHTVVIKEVHNNPIVTVDTWVKTGSVNENDKNNGVAHFLEHLFFKGTKRHKQGEMEQIIESHGGVFNAATSKDYTHYYITIASEYFDTALDLHSDMLLNPAIPLDDLNRERKVVKEEIRRAEDSPTRELFNNLNDILFKSHPYRYTTLGTEDVITNISRDEIFDFYNKWYVPSNMVTIVVGDVDTKEVLAKVKEKFKYESTEKFKPVKHPREPYIAKSQTKISKGDYNTGYMLIGFKGTDIKNKKDNYALDIAASVLGDGRSSRLYQNIKEKKQLATSIDAGHYSLKDDSIFYVSATFEPKNYQALKSAIIDELNQIATEKITQEELDRAKTLAERGHIYANESVSDIADSIGYTMVLTDDIKYYTEHIEDLNKISRKDVQDALRKYIFESRMAVSVVLPKGSDINIKPVAFIQDKYKNIFKYKLDNGMELLTEQNSANDIVSLSVFVKGGNFVEKIPGVADIVAGTLLKGTKTKTALEISKELEGSGIVISPQSGSDVFEIQLKSTKEDFNKAFGILKDVIENPVFKQEYIDKAKKDIMQGILASRDQPISIALDEFTNAMFKGHPYGNTSNVLEKTVPAITRSDVLTFYNQIFSPENMIVSVSGNIDKNDVVRKFESINKRSGAIIVNLKEFKSEFDFLDNNKLVSVKKDTATGWMIMGWPAEGMDSKDYVTLKVIGNILGGGMSSRLFQNLREKQGLAYEISSGYPSKYDKSFFMVYIGTKPNNLAIAKKEFLKEIDKIKTQRVSESELNDVKQKIVGRFALSQETNGQKAHLLGWYEALGKGYKYTYQHSDIIKQVSAEDIIRVANKYLSKPYLLSVIGPKKYVEIVEKGFSSENKR